MRSRMLAVLLSIAGALATGSCAFELGAPSHEVTVETTAPGEPLYVEETPPPPREEVVIGEPSGP
jgi:hypothetical protein